MNISSPSLGFVNHFATSPPLATTGRLPPSVSKGADNMKDGVGEHGAGRTNRLTQALSAALRELGIGGTGSTGMKPGKTLTPATTDITAAAAASPAAPSTGGDLNGAIEQFAHALMNALGDALGAGRAARGHSGEHRQDGEHGHQGHGARHNPYGNLAQRLQNLRGAFVITHAGLRQIQKFPAGVILVDDVLTTGSTIDECAKILRHAGFQKVIAITAMRG